MSRMLFCLVIIINVDVETLRGVDTPTLPLFVLLLVFIIVGFVLQMALGHVLRDRMGRLFLSICGGNVNFLKYFFVLFRINC